MVLDGYITIYGMVIGYQLCKFSVALMAIFGMMS